MAQVSQLPCNGDGICMLCKEKPSDEKKLTCVTCFTPWHVTCLASRPETLASTLRWECPDCTMPADCAPVAVSGGDVAAGELVASIRAIEADESLTEREKARKRQKLLSGRVESSDEEDEMSMKKKKGKEKVEGGDDVLKVVGMGLICSFCMQLPERPVTV